MERVFLGLGSNMGNRIGFLTYALKKIGGILSGIRVSNFYETEPMYFVRQNAFLNAVVRGTTDLEPVRLLEEIQEIENSAGRVRTGVPVKGPRVLDVDILLYGNRQIRTERLVCPHPLMHERLFVLIPLLELEPDCTEPGTGVHYSTYRDTLRTSGKGGEVRLLYGS